MSQKLKGYLETVQRGRGFHLVSGWVCQTDGTRAQGFLTLGLPGIFETPLTKLLHRADLVSAGITGAAAFSIAVPVSDLSDEAELVISCTGAPSVTLNPPGRIGTFEPSGAIDTADANGLSGWVFDPGIDLGAPPPLLLLDEEIRVPLRLAVPREDLPYACAGTSDTFGFALLWSTLDDTAVRRLLDDPSETLALDLKAGDLLIEHRSLDRKSLDFGATGRAILAERAPSPIAAPVPPPVPAALKEDPPAAEKTPAADAAPPVDESWQDTAGRFGRYFDWHFYADRYMTPSAGKAEAVDHFLTVGLEGWSMPAPIIDPAYMREMRPDLFGERLSLAELLDCLDNNLVDPSPFFSSAYYRSQAQSLPPSASCMGHFIKSADAIFRSPTPFFDLTHYRTRHLDPSLGNLASFVDFVLRGDRLRLSSCRHFDPERYAGDCSAEDLATVGPLEHYLRFGRYGGREIYPLLAPGHGRELHLSPTSEWCMEVDPLAWQQSYASVSEAIHRAQRRTLVAFKEQSVLPPAVETDNLDALYFDLVENPTIDIILPVYNEFEHTLKALQSIRRSTIADPYRVILIDDASTDPRIDGFANVPGLVYLRNASNLHFLRSCNLAFREASADFVLLFNNDALLLEKTLQTLLDALRADKSLASVGPMILYPNGRLQEAGCSIGRDGSAKMVGLGDDPERDCYAYDRHVDYISGACVLFRRSAVEGDLFDERFAPAYCEDVDLGLRFQHQGFKTKYIAAARAIHHLSVSTRKASEIKRRRLAATNQQKLAEKWSDVLAEKSKVRVLSFYLPQFHPTVENDLWWGAGFTEWTNTAKAVPSYWGHYQPHLPADLGYYDLRLTQVMGKQQALARRYGLEGFVVYYYNFGSRRVLWEPMRNLLADASVDFRFALCWANENWTRHWDGGDKEILLAQEYDDKTLSALCEDFVAAAADPRSIKVDGKPLALVYRPLLIPDVAGFAAKIRKAFAEAGFPGLHLVYVESMEAVSQGIRPSDIGFDASVEFPPQGIGARASMTFGESKKNWDGKVYDYEASVIAANARAPVDYPRYPGVFPSWDNTARQSLTGTSFYNASPEVFQRYVEAKVDHLNDYFVGEERLLFVNAWNEWAEGTHLEPDKAYGHAWLEAIRNGLASV